MTRRKLFLVAVCGCSVVLFTIAWAYWGLTRIPQFYQAALQQPIDPTVRRESAKRFVQQTMQLVDDIKFADTWSQEFTEQQINSWLAEELHQKFGKWVPPGVSDPRVKLTGGVVHVGFHLEQEDWQGIVSLKIKPWVAEPNQLAIRIESIRAGLFPIPLDTVLNELTQQFEIDGRQIEWREIDGADVAIVHMAGTAADAPVLQSIEISEGSFRVSGNRNRVQELAFMSTHRRVLD